MSTKHAQAWAQKHPEYCGRLDIGAYVTNGRGGRRGTKLTTYKYVVVKGQARALRGKNRFNGICDMTHRVYLEPVLTWYNDGVYNIRTTDEMAAKHNLNSGYHWKLENYPDTHRPIYIQIGEEQP
jgi:hypothetical protein